MGVIGEANRDSQFHAITETLPRSRQEVLKAIIGAEPFGLTRHEIAIKIYRPLSSVCGRVNELEKAGLIVETNEHRETEFGGSATVLRLAEQFRDSKAVQKEFDFDVGSEY